MEHIKPQKESPMAMMMNLAFNIIIPVMVLKRLSTINENGPLIALLIALAFPISYFLYEYIKLKKRNWISVLGFVHVLLTGLFALLQLGGIWFAVKEAAIPFLIGVFVYLSPYLSKVSLVEIMILNPAFFRVEELLEKLRAKNTEEAFQKHLRKTNVFLSYSFFLSAGLNFFLAIYIFQDIPMEVDDMQRSVLLNEQISDMTWMSWLVIVVPSMLCLILIMQYLSKGMKKYADVSLFDLIEQN
tara:strand:+ start:1472 stop:2200 length:729 start_codon:yes stop_codon:yes gene_type:complete